MTAPIPIHVAFEDSLSGAIIDKLNSAVTNRFAIGNRYSRGGIGYIARSLPGFNLAARGVPFLVMADLDTNTCPRELIDSWLRAAQHPNLIVRIAVKEVESWLLADRKHISRFLGVPVTRLPMNADAISDPKQLLVNLARSS